MKILLTGATGFVGQTLVKHLLEQTDAVLLLPVRKTTDIRNEEYKQRIIFTRIGDISSATDWKNILRDCNVVIHVAARVHIIKDPADDPLMAFREINVEGTLNLARQAMQAGVQRFIFLSSIKVNGEYTLQGKPFFPEDAPKPVDPYAISKYEAEKGLIYLAEEGHMDVVIIRSPLIYGPGVKGNFLRMLQLLHKQIPLPFASFKKNKRSLVSLDNLVDLIRVCIFHPNAANQTFLISDGDDLSTADILRKIRKSLGNKIPIFPIPLWVLSGAATVFGKKEEFNRIHDSLQIDISKLQKLLNWTPVEGVDQPLNRTVRDYLNNLVS